MRTRQFFLITIIIFCCAISGIGESIDNLIDKAKNTLKSGDAKKSAEMLNNLLTGMKSEIRNHPRHAEAWYYFSVALDKLGRKGLSAKALDRAKKLKQMQPEKKVEDGNQTADTNSAAIQPNAPEKVRADEITDKLDEKQQNIDHTPVNSAYSLASVKDLQAAEFYRKGAAYLEQGQLQAAADQFVKACETEKGSIELLEKTAAVLDQIGGNYYVKAQRIYAELEKLSGDKMSAAQKTAQARANIFSSKPDLKKANEILDGILKADDKNVEAIVLSGQADTEEQKYKPAIEKFEKAIKLDKNNMPAYLGLGHCYLTMNQLEKAIATLSTARDIWPDSFKPLVALGNAYLKNDNLGSALQMFNTAFSINEQDFEVNLGLLEIFVRSNDPRASVHLEICEKIFKGDPRVEFLKANFLELDEKLLAAKKAYTWLAMYDDETGVRARVRLGQLYSGDGHKTFPGSVLVKNRPTYLDNYRSLANYKLAYNYFQEALDKKTDLKETAEIKTWLNENEERIGESFQFDSLIQSHFRQ